jgi:LacI family transcriptional regulator, galactose operon repressor
MQEFKKSKLPMKLTIKQIAKVAGLSVPTISQVLNNTGRISEKTRKHVWKVCNEMGYKTNASARAIRTGRFGAMTVLLCREEHSSYFPRPLLDGINDEIVRQNLSLNIAQLPNIKLIDEESLPRFLRERMTDGLLVIHNSRLPKQEIKILSESELPTIWINSQHKADCIYPDDYSGTKLATESLLKLGHQKIAYVDYSNLITNKIELTHYSAMDRYSGYKETMKKAGFKSNLLGGKKVERNQRVKLICQWLKSDNRPTAVITYGGSAAHAVLFAAIAECKLKIPEDLSVISNGIGLEDFAGIPITSAIYSAFKMGANAVKMLTDKIENPTSSIAPVAMPYHLEAGATTAPLK